MTLEDCITHRNVRFIFEEIIFGRSADCPKQIQVSARTMKILQEKLSTDHLIKMCDGEFYYPSSDCKIICVE